MPTTADFFQAGPRHWRARLATSVDLMRELSRYTDPDETYQVFARRMAQLYPTARQLSLSRRGLGRPEFRVTRFNLWESTANPYRDVDELPVRRGGLLADLLYADEPRVIDDLDAIELSPDDPARGFLHGQRSVLSVPLFDHGTAQNLLVVTRPDPHAFPREQVPELVWMSNLFGRAVQAQVLGDQVRELYAAADYELRAIADLQNSLLPADVPAVPGLDVAVHYRAANRAGGDYYDFFPLPGGRLGVLLADVSGHGTPAAVLLAITHGLAHAYTGPLDRPAAVLAHLNRHLAAKYTATTGHFVTAVYAVFDPAAGTLTYAVGRPPAAAAANVSRVGERVGRRPAAARRVGRRRLPGADSLAAGRRGGGPAHRRHPGRGRPGRRAVRRRPAGRRPGRRRTGRRTGPAGGGGSGRPRRPGPRRRPHLAAGPPVRYTGVAPLRRRSCSQRSPPPRWR